MVRSPTFRLIRALLGSRRWNSSSSLTLATSALLTNLFQSCRSCGIKLQSTDPSKPGYFIDSSSNNTKKYVRKEDEVFQKYMTQLPEEDQKLLINDFSSSPSSDDISSEILKSLKDTQYNTSELQRAKNANKPSLENKDSVECIRCRDATYRSNFHQASGSEFPTESLETVVSPIPQEGNIVYIISAQDFPMSLDTKIFQFRSPQKIQFIVNKSDLLFKNNNLSLKYGLTFVQDYLHTKFGVPRENVMVMSGLVNWNVKSVVNFIKDGSYIVGNVNSGKSTIIKSILYHLETQKKKKSASYLSKRERVRLEKEQDRMVNSNHDLPSVNSYKAKKEAKKFEALFKAKVGPGVSYMPGFTRGFIQIDLEGSNKTIYDVPGFVKNADDKVSHGIFKLVKQPSLVKQINKGTKVFDKGFFYSKYTTVKNGQCMTMGGLMYIKFPQKSMFQVRNCVNTELKVFSNLQKAINVSLDLQHYSGVETHFLTHHTRESMQDLKRFVVPPFYGAIDLVVQNVGHINIIPTGGKSSNEPIVLYVAPGVQVIVRQPITKYIAKSFSGRDANGNVLKKENYLQKSSFVLQRYSGKEPFFSGLITTRPHELESILHKNNEPIDCESILQQDYESIRKWYAVVSGHDKPFDDTTIVNESNRYQYWYEN